MRLAVLRVRAGAGAAGATGGRARSGGCAACPVGCAAHVAGRPHRGGLPDAACAARRRAPANGPAAGLGEVPTPARSAPGRPAVLGLAAGVRRRPSSDRSLLP